MRAYIVIGFVCWFVMAEAQTGPGGVGATDGSSSLMFWIDASRAVSGSSTVTNWNDLSGRNVLTTVHGNPTLVPTAVNGYSTVRFDGVQDQVVTNQTINAISYPDLNVIAVYRPRVALSGSVWGEDNGEWDRFLTDINLVPTLNESVGAGYDPITIAHPCNHIPGLFLPGRFSLSNVIYREDVYNATEVRVNGLTRSVFTSTAADYQSTGFSSFYVGAIGSNGFNFDGDIAEVMVFGDILNSVEQVIVENYLSAKYDIPLDDPRFNIYNEDDLGFDHDVAGIGRLNNDQQTTARGSGMVRITATEALDDDEFLMWGHNNGVISATNTVDVPSDVQARSNRVWAVSEASLSGNVVDVGAVDVTFDLSGLGSVTASYLRLIIDTDGDGLFSDETSIRGFIADGNNLYTVPAITGLDDNTRFTIGTSNVNQTPLPVELLSFKVSAKDGDIVSVDWVTASESNVQSFDVLRSSDGVDWHSVSNLLADGNSRGIREYHTMDHFPYPGTSYYKLVELDFDGNTTTLGVAKLQRPTDDTIAIYPNPCVDILNVRGTFTPDASLRIYDLQGVSFTNNIVIHYASETGFELDVSQLLPGDYILVGKGFRRRIVKSE